MNLRSLAVAAGMLAALTLTPLAAPAQAGAYADCGEVSFSKGSTVSAGHYGVQKIQADGTSCGTAKKVAAKAEDEQGEPSYSTKGFTCKQQKLRGDGRRPYSCTKKQGSKVVARVKFIAVGLG